MQDQSTRLDLLQRAVETMAEQMLAMQAELAALRNQLQAADHLKAHLLARADQLDAMQACLTELERRVLRFSMARQNKLHQHPSSGNKRTKKRRPHHSAGAVHRRRLALLLLTGLTLVSGLALMHRSLLIRRDSAAWSGLSTSQRIIPATPSLAITMKGPSWLEVQTSDGKTLYYGLAKQGNYAFPATTTLRVRAGRPDLVVVRFAGSTELLGSIGFTGWRIYRHQ